MTDYTYCFFVEYLENGVRCSDSWSTDTLNDELAKGEVQILHVKLSYDIQVTLGLVED